MNITDILALVGKTPTASTFISTLELYANKEPIEVRKVITVEHQSNFETHYADDIFVTVLMDETLVKKYLYPSRRDITAVLTKDPVYRSGDQVNNVKVTKTKYLATLLDASNADISGNADVVTELNLKQLRLQLHNPNDFELGRTQLGGSYEGTPGDIVRSVLTKVVKGVNVPADVKLDGITMVPPDETDYIKNVLVDHGTMVYDFPAYIHKYGGGLYNHSLGSYIRNKQWFIYPLFDTTRYRKEKATVDIVIPNTAKAGVMDITYASKDGKLYVVAGGASTHTDFTELAMLNNGNGVRVGKADGLFNKLKIEGNRVYADAEETTAQIKLVERPNGYDYAPYSANAITDNTAYELSKVAKQLGQVVEVKWMNSNVDLIRPGMPCRLLNQSNVKYPELHGTVLAVSALTQISTQRLTDNVYQQTATLVLFVRPKV